MTSELTPCPRCKRERPSDRPPTVEDCMCTPAVLAAWELDPEPESQRWGREADDDWDYHNDDDQGE